MAKSILRVFEHNMSIEVKDSIIFLTLVLSSFVLPINAMKYRKLSKGEPVIITRTSAEILVTLYKTERSKITGQTSMFFVFSGAPEHVKLFEMWSKTEGEIEDLEKALEVAERKGFGINKPIQACIKKKSKDKVVLGELSLAAYHGFTIDHSNTAYAEKKSKLLEKRFSAHGMHAIMGASICKKLEEIMNSHGEHKQD